MTVIFNDAFTQYTGTGAKTFFEFGFPVLEGGSVAVFVDGLPVAFTLQATGVVLDPAPALNALIEIFRLTDVTQLSNWEEFESFPAAKTEDAVDKLIMLKQEGHFRAAMNLFADPKLDRVILVNDKGDDAHILIWNETGTSVVINDAGVFAGLVTTMMPCPGAVVEKPDHFAYFQYGAVEQQILTTTLYPIEVTDGLDLNIALVDGFMFGVGIEDYTFVVAALDGSITQILLTISPENEDYTFVVAALNGSITEILLTIPPENEDYTFVVAALDGNITSKLVNALMPEEGMDLSIALVAGSMTPV